VSDATGSGGTLALGTVVGRISPIAFSVLIDSGWTVTVKVSSELAAELKIGQRAGLVLAPDGAPGDLRLVTA
jgi:hypothetical protein